MDTVDYSFPFMELNTEIWNPSISYGHPPSPQSDPSRSETENSTGPNTSNEEDGEIENKSSLQIEANEDQVESLNEQNVESLNEGNFGSLDEGNVESGNERNFESVNEGLGRSADEQTVETTNKEDAVFELRLRRLEKRRARMKRDFNFVAKRLFVNIDALIKLENPEEGNA